MNNRPPFTTLNEMTKDELIAVAYRLNIPLGDYARKSKQQIHDLVLAFNPTIEQTEAALKAYRNTPLKRSERQAAELDAIIQSTTPKELAMNAAATAPLYTNHDLDTKPIFKADELDLAPSPNAVAADLAAAQQLIALLKGTKGIDKEAVQTQIDSSLGRALPAILQEVADKIAASTKPVIHTEVITGKSTVVLEQHVPHFFPKLLKIAGLRKNILMVGPAGCGKTTVAALLAKALDLPFSSISCSAGMSEGHLLGRLLPIGEAGRFEYVESEFVHAYENGGIFLIDELDASDENTLIILNQALANGHFYLPSRTGNTYCKRHPDFVCIAAANTFGHGADMIYAGRNKLDGATLDRFRSAIIVMDYDLKYEAQRCAQEVLAWGYAIRKAISDKKLRRIMSTRALSDFSDQLAVGLTKKDWEDSYFADWSRDELAKVGR